MTAIREIRSGAGYPECEHRKFKIDMDNVPGTQA